VPIQTAMRLADHGYDYYHQGGFQFATDVEAWAVAEPFAEPFSFEESVPEMPEATE
jgi:hypothetical protein